MKKIIKKINKKLPKSLPAGFWSTVQETGQIPDCIFYVPGWPCSADRPPTGRAASGGAFAPEPPRATRIQPESIQKVNLAENPPFSPRFFRVEPALARELGNKTDTQSGGVGIWWTGKNFEKHEKISRFVFWGKRIVKKSNSNFVVRDFMNH